MVMVFGGTKDEKYMILKQLNMLLLIFTKKSIIQSKPWHKQPNYPYGINGNGRGYSGVTQSTVNNIVSGRNNSATVSTIKKLCDGLGITFDEFFHSELFAGLEQEIK